MSLSDFGAVLRDRAAIPWTEYDLTRDKREAAARLAREYEGYIVQGVRQLGQGIDRRVFEVALDKALAIKSVTT